LIRQGELKKAESLLEREDTSNPAAAYWKAFVMFRTGRYEQCSLLAARSIELRPEDAAGRKLLGLCRFMQGDAGLAERELRQATELDPSDSEALYYLGRVYFESHNLPAALNVFQKLVTIDPRSVRAYNHLGQTFEKLSRFDDARTAYQKAIQIEQTQTAKSEWPYFNLGVLFLKEGRPREAVDLLQQALSRDNSREEVRIQLAVALFSAGRIEDARRLLSEVLAANPKSADAHYQMGRLLLKAGDSEQARYHLKEFESLRKPH
jgi:Flp pilus assembly protein TadD